MDGARLPGRGPPFIGPLPFIIGPLPFIIGPLPFIMGPPGPGGPRGCGAEESLGGGCAIPFVGAGAGAGAAGRFRLAMLRWWRIAYKLSMRGTDTPASCASFKGDPR